MVRIILGSVVAAIVLFGWGAVYWMHLPFAGQQIHPLPQEAAVMQLLKDNIKESGLYFSPYHDPKDKDETKNEEMQKKHKEGPLVQVTYRRDGADMMAPMYFAKGLGQILVSTFLAAILLYMAAPSIQCYFTRAAFVFLAGLFAAAATTLSGPIWFNHPWGFPLVQAGYEVSSWLLAGIVLGAIVRRPTA